VHAKLVLPVVLAAFATAPEAAWACRPPNREARVHVSFLADSDLAAMAKWAKESACIDYSFASSLSTRRLGQSVIFAVAGDDVGAVLELLLHSMSLHSRGAGSRRMVVADGPESEESRASNLREKAESDQDRIFANIESEIQRKDARHFSISRRGADAALANLAAVAHSLRAVPESKDNRPVGFRLVGMKPSGLLLRLGFRNGDVVESVNGRELTAPDKAIEAYSKLRSTTDFNVRLLRNGKPLSIEVKIL